MAATSLQRLGMPTNDVHLRSFLFPSGLKKQCIAPLSTFRVAVLYFDGTFDFAISASLAYQLVHGSPSCISDCMRVAGSSNIASRDAAPYPHYWIVEY